MSDSQDSNLPSMSQFLVYQTEDGRTKIEVRLHGESAWLTQAQIAELFQTTVPNISMHLRNVFAEGELQPNSVVKEFLTTAADGHQKAAASTKAEEGRQEVNSAALNAQPRELEETIARNVAEMLEV